MSATKSLYRLSSPSLLSTTPPYATHHDRPYWRNYRPRWWYHENHSWGRSGRWV